MFHLENVSFKDQDHWEINLQERLQGVPVVENLEISTVAFILS